jgi:hypothetical protein
MVMNFIENSKRRLVGEQALIHVLVGELFAPIWAVYIGIAETMDNPAPRFVFALLALSPIKKTLEYMFQLLRSIPIPVSLLKARSASAFFAESVILLPARKFSTLSITAKEVALIIVLSPNS